MQIVNWELAISLIALGIAIFAAFMARQANAKSQSAIDHSLPHVEYSRGYENEKLVHNFWIGSLAEEGWSITKIDISKGKSDVFIRNFNKIVEADGCGNVLYGFEKAVWPISNSGSLIL